MAQRLIRQLPLILAPLLLPVLQTSPPLPHPRIDVARGKHPFRILPVEPLIVGDVAHVPELHGGHDGLNPLREVTNRGAILHHGIDPVVLETVWQLSQNREDVAKPFRQSGIDLVFDRAGIPQAQNLDLVAGLADTLDAALPLFQARWVPGEIDVDLGAEPLEVESFACGIGCANETDIAALDGLFDLLATCGSPFGTLLDERRRTACVDSDTLVRVLGTQGLGDPFRCRQTTLVTSCATIRWFLVSTAACTL